MSLSQALNQFAQNLGRYRRAFQIIQFVLFLCISAFLFVRTVDGHGTVQTLEVKLISFAVWALFYLGVLAIEWLIYCIVRHVKK